MPILDLNTHLLNSGDLKSIPGGPDLSLSTLRMEGLSNDLAAKVGRLRRDVTKSVTDHIHVTLGLHPDAAWALYFNQDYFIRRTLTQKITLLDNHPHPVYGGDYYKIGGNFLAGINDEQQAYIKVERIDND